MDEKKNNDNDEVVEIDLKSMTDKQKKKLIDLKKEQSKIEKDKSKIEVDILKKMVDEMKEDGEEDNGDGDDDDESDEAELSILSMYEEIKKKQEETDVHLKANQLLFNMIFGLQSSSSKETDGFVADGQEKRNDITQQILIKASKVDEMERKHKQYQTVFKDLFGSTPDKTSAKTDSVSNRKRPSSGEEQDSEKKKKKKKKKTTKSASIQDALLLTLDQLKKSKSTT